MWGVRSRGWEPVPAADPAALRSVGGAGWADPTRVVAIPPAVSRKRPGGRRGRQASLLPAQPVSGGRTGHFLREDWLLIKTRRALVHMQETWALSFIRQTCGAVACPGSQNYRQVLTPYRGALGPGAQISWRHWGSWGEGTVAETVEASAWQPPPPTVWAPQKERMCLKDCHFMTIVCLGYLFSSELVSAPLSQKRFIGQHLAFLEFSLQRVFLPQLEGKSQVLGARCSHLCRVPPN